MKQLKLIAPYFTCPKCNALDGFEYLALLATCKKCKAAFDVYDLFETVLTTQRDSNLWTHSFSILSNFAIAPIFEGIISDDTIKFKPYQRTDLDLKKFGLPKEARLLYITITQYDNSQGKGPFLSFSYARGNEFQSISELPSVIRIVPFFDNRFENITSEDLEKYQTVSVYIRWYNKLANDVISNHIIHAAEAYWKDDLHQMIYNGFSAFELSLSNLIEDFWKKNKNLSEAEYRDFFDRSGIDKKMKMHIPLLCRELGVVFTDKDKQRIGLLDHLRLQRNAIVHSGELNAKIESRKAKLYAGLCWGLLFLKELRMRIIG
jgi:hypothetical protein